MIIAITNQWNDDSGRFAYYVIENGQVKQREEALPPPGGIEAFARQLCGLEVDLLISLKLPESQVQVLQEHGVCTVFAPPGNADALLKAYLEGSLEF